MTYYILRGLGKGESIGKTNVNTTTCYYISRNGSHTLCLESKVYIDFSKGIRNEKWVTNMMYTGGITVKYT